MSVRALLTVNLSCDRALQVAKRKLSQRGLRALQTFNLYTARLGQSECPCPHHGTEQCDCQMVVLLIYGESPQPVTLILHGSGGTTWFSIADDPSQQGNRALLRSIREALDFETNSSRQNLLYETRQNAQTQSLMRGENGNLQIARRTDRVENSGKE